jgi:hypothetical protein
MPPASHQVSATSLKLLIQQMHPHVRVERDSGMCVARDLYELELGGVGIHDSEDRRIFFDLSQISTTLEHGVYVIARRRASTKSSTIRWVTAIEVRLKIHSTIHSKVDGLSASQD